MFRPLTKVALLTCAVAAVSTPSVSQAGLFDCFRGWGGGGCCDPCGGATTYRPLFPRSGLFGARRVSYYGGGCCNTGCNTCCSPCNTCCSPCTTTCYQVKYVPQTCYRATVCNVPVTTCRRVTCCDPCTGCPVTVCRPCTTYVRQVRYTPYTTYRAVCCPTTCCSPCCDPCCNGGTAVQSTTPVNGGTVVTPNGGTNGQTYKEGSSSSFRQSTPPNNGGSNPGNYNTNYRDRAPQRATPPRDLTTSAPVKKSWTFRRVSSRESRTEAKPAPANSVRQPQPLDDAGWKSVTR